MEVDQPGENGTSEAQRAFESISALLSSSSGEATAQSVIDVQVFLWNGHEMKFHGVPLLQTISHLKDVAVDRMHEEGIHVTSAQLVATTFGGALDDHVLIRELGVAPVVQLSFVDGGQSAYAAPESPCVGFDLNADGSHLYFSPYVRSVEPVDAHPDAEPFDATGATYGSTTLPEGVIEERNQALLPALFLQATTGAGAGAGSCPRAAPTAEHQAEAARFLAHAAHDDAEGHGQDPRSRSSARAERDVWALLDVCTRAELLADLQVCDAQAAQVATLASLPISTATAEAENELVRVDLSLRKGAVLLEWLEEAAAERAEPPPAPAVNSSGSSARAGGSGSSHPDASPDSPHSVEIMRALWGLVRAGQLAGAQELAYAHGLHWLAASLSGAADGFHGSDGADSGSVQHMAGNSRRTAWQKTAWELSEKLAPSRQSATVFEAAIYAALSDNVVVLLSSPVLQGWSDRLWAVVKATHASNIASALAAHKKRQEHHSKLFLGSDKTLLAATDEHRRRVEAAGACGAESIVSGAGVLRVAGEPSSQNSVESVMLQIQAAVIGGRAGLDDWVRRVVTPGLQSREAAWESPRVLRVVCHVCLWMRLSPTATIESLSTLPALTDTVYYTAIEQYVGHLLRSGRQHLVAPYCVFLSAPRRVRIYAQLLDSISPSQMGFDGVVGSAANEAVMLARQYFSPSEVMQIANEAARGGVARAVDGVSESSTARGQLPQASASSSSPSPSKRGGGDTSQHGRVEDSNSNARLDSDQEAQRLQWLLVEPSHRLEALQQACLVASSIATSGMAYGERTQALGVLLYDKLHPDSEECGWALLRLERERLEQEQGKHGEDERSALALREKRWRACLLQLQYWRDYVTASEDVTAVHRAYAEVSAAPGSVQAIQRLQNVAERALGSIMNSIRGGTSEGAGCGVAAVWLEAEVAAVRGAQLAHLQPNPNTMTEAAYVSLPSVEELHSSLGAASLKLDSIFPPMQNGPIEGTQARKRAVMRVELENVVSLLRAEARAMLSESAASDAMSSAPARAKLGECCSELHSALSGVVSARAACRDSLSEVVGMYLQVCSSCCGAALTQPSGQEQSLYWHSRACAFADVLADPDPTLQLYHVLPKQELAAVLAKMADSARAIVDGRGSFELRLTN